jgi:ActR/RegA family two-component response regulator
MIISNGEGSVTADTLSFLRASSAGAGSLDDLTLPPEGISIEALQYNLVKQAMEQTGNNQSAAANLLGLTRAKFRVLIKQAMDDDI